MISDWSLLWVGAAALLFAFALTGCTGPSTSFEGTIPIEGKLLYRG